MATRINIPAAWVNGETLDINDFFNGQSLTVISRSCNSRTWSIDVVENLNPGQQTALSVAIENAFQVVTFESI